MVVSFFFIVNMSWTRTNTTNETTWNRSGVGGSTWQRSSLGVTKEFAQLTPDVTGFVTTSIWSDATYTWDGNGLGSADTVNWNTIVLTGGGWVNTGYSRSNPEWSR